MNCRDTIHLLNGYVDAELDLPGALTIEEHLQTCPRCRTQEATLRSLRSAVQRHTNFQAAPDSLRARLQASYGRKSSGGCRWSRQRLAFAVPAFAVLVVVAFIGFTGLKEEKSSPARGSSKIVYHISHSDTASTALRNLANHLEASPEVKVVVVAHNDGVDFLLRGARDESGQLYEAAVGKFKERGVEFRVCNNTLVRRSINSGQVIPEAHLVPSGIAEISRLQSREGYAYMKL